MLLHVETQKEENRTRVEEMRTSTYGTLDLLHYRLILCRVLSNVNTDYDF